MQPAEWLWELLDELVGHPIHPMLIPLPQCGPRVTVSGKIDFDRHLFRFGDVASLIVTAAGGAGRGRSGDGSPLRAVSEMTRKEHWP